MIMLLIVLGAIAADYLLGVIKAYVTNTIQSSKMRKGGMGKLCEIIVMAVACGLELGLGKLGEYYQAAELAQLAGAFTAGAVFAYILVMELISILENYAEINPDAAWIVKIIRKLKNFNDMEE